MPRIGVKILVVDDNSQIRYFMRECLAKLGFDDIAEANNGKVALEISKKQLPDIITLDWNMPEIDGLAYLKELRRLPGGTKPAVIFCSTEDAAPKIKKVLAAGADKYITKPFDLHILRETLKSLGLI